MVNSSAPFDSWDTTWPAGDDNNFLTTAEAAEELRLKQHTLENMRWQGTGPHSAADTAYDSDALRQFLRQRGTLPVIPNNPTRRHLHAFDRNAYKRRNLIERALCRLKDWRRVATRYDKLARNFHSAVAIA